MVGPARPIRLEHRPRDIVDAHHDRVLRGPFRSRVDGSVHEYASPRRFLGTTSDDVMRLAEAAPDRPGVAHRRAHATSLSPRAG